MTPRQADALDAILSALPDDRRAAFREVAEYAIMLGYMPTRQGARGTYVDFVKRRVGKTILKIDVDPHFPPRLALKFYALPTYEGVFGAALERAISVWKRHGYEARCFGCGRCDGTHGYVFAFPHGDRGFLCGRGVFDLPAFDADCVPAVKEALRIQDMFFVGPAAG